ncbi:MAG: hypothetical protein ACO3VG_05195, partial [Nitriliruptoraceae bacterium]
MEKRTMLAAAGAVVLVVATGGVALGVNLGLMQAPPGQDVGPLEVASARGSAGFDRLPGLLERVAEQVAAFLRQDESRRAFMLVF